MSWHTVIHLNLVRSVNCILNALERTLETETSSRMNLLRIRLSPLCRVQHDLETCLGLAGGDEVYAATDLGVFRRPTEFCLCSRYGWAAVLGLAKTCEDIISVNSPADVVCLQCPPYGIDMNKETRNDSVTRHIYAMVLPQFLKSCPTMVLFSCMLAI
jgi:hypothetical protein